MMDNTKIVLVITGKKYRYKIIAKNTVDSNYNLHESSVVHIMKKWFLWWRTIRIYKPQGGVWIALDTIRFREKEFDGELGSLEKGMVEKT